MAHGSNDYRIHLNFLAVAGEVPAFFVYRKAIESQQEERPFDGAVSFKLPAEGIAEWPSFWISFSAREGFERHEIQSNLNRDLTRHALRHALTSAANASLAPERIVPPKNAFLDELSFVMETHPEGCELLVAQPYHLRIEQRLGFLVDFHFKLKDGVQFSRRVQQLCMTLDRNGRRNLDYCSDRASKIGAFLKQIRPVFDTLSAPGTDRPITLNADFASLPADRLRSRIYVFGNNKESRSQFLGLKEHGPLRPVQSPPKLLFVFREEDRNAARLLAMSLRGTTTRGLTFPGFKALFKTDIDIDRNPVVLPDLSPEAMRRALDRVIQERVGDTNLLPVIVLPNQEDNGYLTQKSIFSHSEIPTQVCTLRILQDQESLKWAVGNLALQMFCKAGGMPWKVRATPQKSLIIGISQSHKLRKVDGRSTIERYFAFSIMTDNSGLFQKIQVLGEGHDEHTYITNLKDTLRQELRQSAAAYSRVVIHTSFKLKFREIDAIKSVVDELARPEAGTSCKFAVIKINHKSRFFGINEAENSLVPYEGTKVALGNHEYLIWFEGIFPDKTTVSKAFPGPTHLHFLRVKDQAMTWEEERDLLQDLVNLSGANWRGFNAKAAPVSVFYCHLVADLVHDLHEKGLPLPAVHDIRPWFL